MMFACGSLTETLRERSSSVAGSASAAGTGTRAASGAGGGEESDAGRAETRPARPAKRSAAFMVGLSTVALIRGLRGVEDEAATKRGHGRLGGAGISAVL